MKTTMILRETLVPFEQARRLLPGSPSRHQMQYWQRKGIKVGDERITLEWCLIGRRRYTSQEAYQRFLEKVNGPSNSLRGVRH